ncbi:YihY/virulence factor BrkB family protein [Micromonospora sp. NPDC047134]|uniref:YihY/virulence factor BrkB family protein n=1 Tax=Micromonospora sp. NPDC047134 TaxID=3154340 RepID=UPI0033D2AF0F
MASENSSSRDGRGSAQPANPEPARPDDDQDARSDGNTETRPRDQAARSDGNGGSRAYGGDAGVGREEPRKPTHLSWREWVAALRRTVREFSDDRLGDWAAALTYYGVLSIFPGLLVLVSLLGLLGLLGPSATEGVRDTVDEAVPEQNIRQIIDAAIDQAQGSGGLAGLAAIVGLLAAFWSASGYVAAFMRAANAIYDVPEGRPIWKTLPIRVAVTAVIGALLLTSAVIVVFTGRIAEHVGSALGVGRTAVTVWDLVKWPVLLVLVSLMFAILYWATPNARQGGFRWVSPGGVLAVLLWLLVSGAFAVYVANFGSYNKTYGALAGVIIFLVWLWLSNVAILLGAEFDAELARSRAIAGGLRPVDREPYIELRDDRKLRSKDHPPKLF